MSDAVWAAGGVVVAACLAGDGLLRRYLRTRAERSGDDATTAAMLQKATAAAVRTVSESAETTVHWAQEDAKRFQQQAQEAHEELRRVKDELVQVREGFVRLRAEMEAERAESQAEREAMRQAAGRREAELNAIILSQQAEILRLRADWIPNDPRELDLGN